MGVFHFFYIVQMVPSVKRVIYAYLVPTMQVTEFMSFDYEIIIWFSTRSKKRARKKTNDSMAFRIWES